jgi:hypothetical protein
MRQVNARKVEKSRDNLLIIDNNIRSATSMGRPFGNDALISLLEERLNRTVRISSGGRP